ncbi:hypothetical protein DFQ27_003957 [Actinomortierella ambigua]|uniref:Uncharacterized protein n=1 Tax=Actinomortierella ambigua TaxID=1343610 RepID=A0A9P6Q556_9FUNG|nr:hypothetical protein DFQ27_003957 [Actinomortierella ambigua]
MVAQFSFSDVRYSPLNRATRNKRLWIVAAGICFIFTLSLIHLQLKETPDTTPTTKFSCARNQQQIDEKRRVVGKQWIVVTTINPPTDAMDLLCNLEGWNVVVVADTKSPKQWKSGSCVYLSVEEQQCLSYDIVDVIPYRAYTRKNIGYLWAIQQGATKIFDTDDDNLPTGKDIFVESPTGGVVGYRSGGTTGKSVNIYSHFGRPDIWPRGFPLDDIDIRRPVSYMREYDSLTEEAKGALAPPMLIQQGLADLDPDVDAIFRLTQVRELKHVKFLSFRVCDIWRGYWVQRLLWDVDGSLGFTKPTVDQIRNAHNYLDDYKDELQIYAETTKFIDFLSSWTSSSTRLETRIVSLMEEMAKHEFIGPADVDLAKRWVQDLQNVGYVFPKVRRYDQKRHGELVKKHEEQRLYNQTDRWVSDEALRQCQLEETGEGTGAAVENGAPKIQITPTHLNSTAFKNILLVVNFNHPDYDALEPFMTIYKKYFPNIKVYGPRVPDHLKDQVSEAAYDEGFTSYRSIADAIEKYPDYDGYLYTNDDTLLNVYQLAEFDQDKVWKPVPDRYKDVHDLSRAPPNKWPHWGKIKTTEMWNDPTSLTAKQRERIADFHGLKGQAHIRAYADGVYVPARISKELAGVLKTFAKYEVFLEGALGMALIAVEPTENWVRWQEVYLWEKDRLRWRDFLKPGVSMLHPVKLKSEPSAIADSMQWIESVEINQ